MGLFAWLGKQIKVKTKKGKEKTLLNPAQKGRKFSEELRTGAKFTNSGDAKLDKNGRAIMLTDVEKAYRSGYLDSRSDSAKAYKYNKNKNSTR